MSDIQKIALSSPSLQEVALVSLPDCLLVKAWSDHNQADVEERAVEYGGFQDQAVRLAQSLGAGPLLRCTLEAEGRTLVMLPVSDELVAVFQFTAGVPLGLARTQAQQLIEHLRAGYGPPLVQRVKALVEDIRRRAPEPQAVLAHVARSAGIQTSSLDHPESLDDDQLRAVLASVPRGP